MGVLHQRAVLDHRPDDGECIRSTIPISKRGVQRIDWTGIALLTGWPHGEPGSARGCGEEVDWFASNWIIVGTIIGAAGLIALVICELDVSLNA